MEIKSWASSKKTKDMIIGIVSITINSYLFKDNPEILQQLNIGIGSLVGGKILSQGAADAFGSEAYHLKSKLKESAESILK